MRFKQCRVKPYLPIFVAETLFFGDSSHSSVDMYVNTPALRVVKSWMHKIIVASFCHKKKKTTELKNAPGIIGYFFAQDKFCPDSNIPPNQCPWVKSASF